MKLTERQLLIRNTFREGIIDLWLDKKRILMFNLPIYVAEKLQSTVVEIREEMEAIPSIGKSSDYMPINVWVAKYFNPIANALWDKKSKQSVLTLWSKTKRTIDVTPKANRETRNEMKKINKDHKKFQAIAELRHNMPDRWEKTSWSKVK